ncbi:Hypothetical predicted protein [Octopus vulgaris]|uniref:Uncharacterized protein n=1 Tax=Octopus vulgaris TaxID=6645 RepID=A0AA36FFK1_OCTVU|nr:Hypothetical predicted protein [Octopus vulgaris]
MRLFSQQALLLQKLKTSFEYWKSFYGGNCRSRCRLRHCHHRDRGQRSGRSGRRDIDELRPIQSRLLTQHKRERRQG